MNKPVIAVAVLTACLLISCSRNQPNVALEVPDIENYLDWKDDQEDVEIEPFKAEPIQVTGTGTVRAAPDIAVLTGLIQTEANIDHEAMDASANIINRVQEIIDGKDVVISFTTISSAELRDETCLAFNREASQRHNDINADNWFNKRELSRREDVRQKLREPKNRIAQKVCEVTHVENYIGFTAWVRPSGEVSQYIRAFTEAGVDNVNLFGFDFSNYDALYKEAAEKAVKNAREKAEISARIAGTKLTTVETFSVTKTERRSRYGQQAMIISPHGNRSVTPQQSTTFSDRVIRSQGTPRNSRNYAPEPVPAPRAAFSCWDGTMVFSAGQCPGQPVAAPPSPSFSGSSSAGFSSSGIGSPAGRISPLFETVTETVVVQEASTELVTIPPTYETVYETVVTQEASGNSPAQTQQIARRVVKTPARTTERTVPAVTKQITRRVLKNPGSGNGGGGVSAQTGSSNALNESMLSGSKTCLLYTSPSPRDGLLSRMPSSA